MRRINIESGLEMQISHAAWQGILSRREGHKFIPTPIIYNGDGDPKHIALLLNGNGIGDDICTLPAIYQKQKEGFNVTVIGREFTKTLFTSLGCTFLSEDNHQLGFIEENKQKFGKFYSLKQWCTHHDEESFGNVHKTRFQQFANLIETSLPKEFNFYKKLPTKRSNDILLALTSSAPSRSYSRKTEVFQKFYTVNPPTKLVGKQTGEHTFKSFSEMKNAVAKAQLVVSVDSAFLHLALAVGTPTIAIMGPTDEKTIVDQYKRYSNTAYKVLRSNHKDTTCLRPCSFQDARGYGINNKCVGQEGDCLSEILPSDIFNESMKFLEKINESHEYQPSN